MKTTVLFIHSAGPQGPNEGSTNLIAYLEKELGDNYHFIYPSMPTPESPKYVQWKEKLEKELNTTRIEQNVILVGHSLGGSVLLKYLSEELCSLKISGLFIVASPYWGIDEDWQLNDFILQNNFEQNLKEIPHLFLYHSLYEEIVPFKHQKAYANKLPQATICVLEGDEHLFHNGLPKLVDDIKRL